MNRMMRCWLTCAVVMLLAASGSARAVEVGPESVVCQLYKDFGMVALFGLGDKWGDDINMQPRNVLEKYFDRQLTQYFLNDRICVKKTQGVCDIDVSVLFNSQDPEADSFSVKYVGNGVVRVSIGTQKSDYSNGLTVIDYKVKKIGSRWLIDDIVPVKDGRVD